MLDSRSVIFPFLSTVLSGPYCLLSSEILELLSIWSSLPLLTLSPLLFPLLSLLSPLPSSIFIHFLLFSLVKLYNKYLLKTLSHSFFLSEGCVFSGKQWQLGIGGKASFSFLSTSPRIIYDRQSLNHMSWEMLAACLRLSTFLLGTNSFRERFINLLVHFPPSFIPVSHIFKNRVPIVFFLAFLSTSEE